MTSEFQNPVLPGFFPDPSCVQVDGVFYLVNSTFQFFPGITVHVSTDLISWTQVGSVICRPEQLDLNKSTTKGFHSLGLFAPTIRYHNETFYVVCTNLSSFSGGEQNFIVTSKDPRTGEWSDPILVDFKGIDPSLLFDDDGTVYFTGSHSSTTGMEIAQFEIDIKTGKSLSGPPKYIWSGFSSSVSPEGPHLYKKDGWYYLMIAEGGTELGHLESMARSPSPWGPFESCSRNPLMTNRNTDEYIQAVGHADLFQDDRGLWWAMMLAVRKRCENFPLGRETFLCPVEWPEGEWPVFNSGSSITQHVKLNRTLPGEGKTALGVNTLSSPQQLHPSSPQILYLRNPSLSSYKWLDHGKVTLRGQHANLNTPAGTSAFLGHRQRFLASQLIVTIEFEPSSAEEAGISVYVDVNRHLDLVVRSGTDANTRIITFRSVSLQAGTISRKPFSIPKNGPVQLRIDTREENYSFSYRMRNSGWWVAVDRVSSAILSEWGFTGPVLALIATSNDSERISSPATFSEYSYSSL